MNKTFLAILLSISTSVMALAVNVQTEAGQLGASLGDNYTATQLVVTGTIDARDFKFINENMPNLVSLDLSGATIAAYDSGVTPLFMTVISYEANAIPPTAFFGKGLTSVVLPQSLTTIGCAAFAGCADLESITLPAATDSIASYAFSASGLKSIQLPAAVRVVEEGAFSRCTALTSATIAPQSEMTVGENAFLDCAALSQVTLNGAVTAIGDRAFAGCTALNAITFANGENGITSIGKGAFQNSGITAFNLSGSSLQSVGDWAFAGAKLSSAAFPGAATVGSGLFFNNELLTTAATAGAEIPDYSFAECEALANSNVISSATTSIGDYAFYNDSGIKSLSIPTRVEHIGTQAMAGTIGLETLEADAPRPAELGDDVWAGIDQPAVTLTVPSASIELYRNALQWQDFTIRTNRLRGDVNLDGQVGVADVTAVYSLLLGVSHDYEDTADVNEDGQITVADITSIYNIILGVTSAYGAPKPAVHVDSDELLTAPEEVTIDKSKTTMVEVDIENTVSYTSFQFDIDVPQGVKITDISIGRRTQGHIMGYNEIAENKYRVVAYSTTNSVLAENGSLVILNLSLAADDSFTGSDDMTLNNAIFVEPNEDSHYLQQPTNVRIKRNTVTGIDDIANGDANGPVNVFNTQGQLIRSNVERAKATQGLPAGIYIVGNKKVIVR